MLWSEVWFGRDFASRILRTALTPASWLYAGGWSIYASVYAAGLKRPKHPHSPVVCVGNLTVGGSGKTPMTIYLAELLLGLGFEVVVGCSGYGSPQSEEATLTPPGDLSALKWGDEAALLRWRLPKLPLVVGRNRVLAAKLCQDSNPKAVLLMDDGFQHLPLRKDLVILLDPPVPNRRCLPAGPYREPASNRTKADLVLPGEFKTISSAMRFVDAESGLASVQPPAASVLCALGSPQKFFEELRRLGIRLDKTVAKPDHHPMQEGNLFDGLAKDQALIVTTKDWVKLREREDLIGRRILIAAYDLKVEPESLFKSWIQEKLHEADKKAN